MEGLSSYKRKLQARLKALIAKEKTLHKEFVKNSSFENISALNNIRVDIITVKSRIEHLNRPSSLEEYKITIIHNTDEPN